MSPLDIVADEYIKTIANLSVRLGSLAIENARQGERIEQLEKQVAELKKADGTGNAH